MALSREEVKEKVVEIINERLGSPDKTISEETTFVNDLGADSLDQVELVMELEDAFDLNIPDEEAENIQTVGDAINYIVEHN